MKPPKNNQLVVRRGAVPPSVYLHSVTDKQWEEFIAEACRKRDIGEAGYVSVKVLGNAGDKGRDIEARLVESLLPDLWDLYQGKHYGQPLSPSEAFPEMVKFFGHLLAKSYPIPRKYYFCAARNAGPDLHDLLADPEMLRASLLAAWRDGKRGLQSHSAQLTSEMLDFVSAFDFSRFEECQVVDLLDWHARDPVAHYKLFGIEPERGDDPTVPSQAMDNEMTYITELICAYSEACGETLSLTDVLERIEYAEHLDAARETFYAAEGLKRFSRDLYDDDEFGKLLEMVKKGVRLKMASPQLKTGLERHDAAVDAAQRLSVNDSVLYPKLRGGDLPGTCHHLVNDKHFKWVR